MKFEEWENGAAEVDYEKYSRQMNNVSPIFLFCYFVGQHGGFLNQWGICGLAHCGVGTYTFGGDSRILTSNTDAMNICCDFLKLIELDNSGIEFCFEYDETHMTAKEKKEKFGKYEVIGYDEAARGWNIPERHWRGVCYCRLTKRGRNELLTKLAAYTVCVYPKLTAGHWEEMKAIHNIFRTNEVLTLAKKFAEKLRAEHYAFMPREMEVAALDRKFFVLTDDARVEVERVIAPHAFNYSLTPSTLSESARQALIDDMREVVKANFFYWLRSYQYLGLARYVMPVGETAAGFIVGSRKEIEMLGYVFEEKAPVADTSKIAVKSAENFIEEKFGMDGVKDFRGMAEIDNVDTKTGYVSAGWFYKLIKAIEFEGYDKPAAQIEKSQEKIFETANTAPQMPQISPIEDLDKESITNQNDAQILALSPSTKNFPIGGASPAQVDLEGLRRRLAALHWLEKNHREIVTKFDGVQVYQLTLRFFQAVSLGDFSPISFAYSTYEKIQVIMTAAGVGAKFDFKEYSEYQRQYNSFDLTVTLADIEKFVTLIESEKPVTAISRAEIQAGIDEVIAASDSWLAKRAVVVEGQKEMDSAKLPSPNGYEKISSAAKFNTSTTYSQPEILTAPITNAEMAAIEAMTYGERGALLAKINQVDLRGIFPADGRGKSFVCPICGNGSGHDGTGIECHEENEDGKFYRWYKCFKCDCRGKLTDIIFRVNELERKDFKRMLAIGKRFVDVKPNVAVPKLAPKKLGITPEEIALIDADIIAAQINLENLPVEDRRGLTLDTLNFFHCGYLESWTPPKNRLAGKNLYPSRRLIIPTGEHSYSAILPLRDRKTDFDRKFKAMHAGAKEIFNAQAIQPGKPIVVVEGEIDCMTIWQATGGAVNAIATGGVSNTQNFLTPLNSKIPSYRRGDYSFAVAFDNDKAGNDAAPKLIESLRCLGYQADKILGVI